MHRVRQSLPYLQDFGWEGVVLAVHPDLVEGYRDDHLNATIPEGARVEYVRALHYRWTRRFGLGSLALRSLPFYAAAGNRLLERGEFDLVYFSTTMFPVMVLGRYWKRKFGVPYVIDMQDPWHSEYYRTRPRHERPPKYWFSYRLHKRLEPLAMRHVDAIISVSEGYCNTLQQRYPNIDRTMCRVIPFGGAAVDFEVAASLDVRNDIFNPHDGRIHVVYVGRGGHDMAASCRIIFEALARGLKERPNLFEKVFLHFVGTDYSPDGLGKKTIEPIADNFGLSASVNELPARVPYFTVLKLLQDAHMLLIPGSDDPNYTASKLYPYILARKPLLAVFSETSSVVDILEETGAGEVATFAADGAGDGSSGRLYETWSSLLERLPFTPSTNWDAFEPYTAREMTRRQVEVFDRVVSR